MSIFGNIGKFFKKFGSLILQALESAGAAGLTDDVVQLALAWVRVAATKFTDNTEKREFVVAILVKKGIPEYIARLAVEMAYAFFKKEIERIPGNSTTNA